MRNHLGVWAAFYEEELQSVHDWMRAGTRVSLCQAGFACVAFDGSLHGWIWALHFFPFGRGE